MRGRNDCHPRLWRKLSPGGNVEAFLINWHANNVGSSGQESPTRSRIPGIFEPSSISRIQQHTCDQIKGALRSDSEDNLFRRTANTSRHADMPRDCLAQWKITLHELVRGGIPQRV